MTQWFSKRWALAAVLGAAVTVGFTAARGDGAPPKVGDVITLKYEGAAERKVKILKTEKKADGSYLSEVKDTNSGETFTLEDKADNGSSSPSRLGGLMKGREFGLFKSKQASAPEVAPEMEGTSDSLRDRMKRHAGRMFNKDKAASTTTQDAVTTTSPTVDKPADSMKKPGLLTRYFKKSGSAAEHEVNPTATAKPNKSAVPAGELAGSTHETTDEPPRTVSPKPVTYPALPPLPITVPVFETPPTAGSGTQPIPIPPSGTSSANPVLPPAPNGYVQSASYVRPQAAFEREVQPLVYALQTTSAPSERLTAAKGLAESRHGSADSVKAVLFQAAQLDPCGEVRADCISHLCKLGYSNPNFITYIKGACVDADPLVRGAAKSACATMIR